jgi:dGTPase
MMPAGWKEREALTLAPWAMHAADSAGRVHEEQPHPFRSPYQRDRDRIVHSAAFRRLAHKTQVFTGYPGDYHRSRLTHTLEVTNIARTLARALALNEDLVETLALAHDIGHPPLGHAGEDTLDELLRGQGGFSHNAQALRIMELLETRYSSFPGLNLSREVLDAQSTRARDATAPPPLLETQVVDAADSIAYDTHDADDAIELGLVALEELLELPLVAAAAARVREQQGPLAGMELRRAVLHELVDSQVAHLVTQTLTAIESNGIDSGAGGLRPPRGQRPPPRRALARRRRRKEGTGDVSLPAGLPERSGDGGADGRPGEADAAVPLVRRPPGRDAGRLSRACRAVGCAAERRRLHRRDDGSLSRVGPPAAAGKCVNRRHASRETGRPVASHRRQGTGNPSQIPRSFVVFRGRQSPARATTEEFRSSANRSR